MQLSAITVAWSLLALGACTSEPDQQPPPAVALDCAHVVAHVEQLRADALAHDPVLGASPALAAEHARQTRDAFIAPLTARCDDDAVLRCLAEATSYDATWGCL